jgi:hypothetical protein
VYLVKSLFICLFFFVAAALVIVGVGWGVAVVLVVCLQCHFANEKPPPPHLIAVSVCLRCFYDVLV